MKYRVGITINNCFEIEADSQEEAEERARELDVYQTLDDAEYDITYVDEIKEKSITDKMCDDLIDTHYKTLERLNDGTIICDDEHGNSL
jgi:leucyl-tRNA synthetase